MQYRIRECGRFFAVIFGAVMLVACGALDTDAPAQSPEGGDEHAVDEEASRDHLHPFEESGKADDLEVVETDDGEEQGGEDVEQGDEDEEESEGEQSYHRCIDVCFKSLWCNEDGPDYADCVQHCQSAEASGLMKDDLLYCIEWADDCGDVAYCESMVEPCTEVCGVYDQCGYFNEGVGCHQWCVAEIWAGRLDWSAQGCVTAIGRNDACPDLAACGLDYEEY